MEKLYIVNVSVLQTAKSPSDAVTAVRTAMGEIMDVSNFEVIRAIETEKNSGFCFSQDGYSDEDSK